LIVEEALAKQIIPFQNTKPMDKNSDLPEHSSHLFFREEKETTDEKPHLLMIYEMIETFR